MVHIGGCIIRNTIIKVIDENDWLSWTACRVWV